ALARADVRIAIRGGSDIAAETAGVVLRNSNPSDVVDLMLLHQPTYRKMFENLHWSTAYNFMPLPRAAGVLHKSGIILSPAAGAILMSLSTVIVAINAGFLSHKQPAQV